MMMKQIKFVLPLVICLMLALTSSYVVPVLANGGEYNPGVVAGHYVTYGNFVGIGPGMEQFNEMDWMKYDILAVSEKEVTIHFSGQFKNGTTVPESEQIWDVEAGTMNGTPSVQGAIIAANLTEGDAIPPLGTYYVNKTEDRVYLGVSRSVNIINVSIATSEYTATVTFIYDKISGMLLEMASETIVTTPPTTMKIAFSVIETNLFTFGTVPEFTPGTVILGLSGCFTVLLALNLLKRRRLYL